MMKRLTMTILAMTALCLSPAYAQAEDASVIGHDRVNNHSYIALKTNLLYDAALIPDIGLEVNVHDNWTVYGDVMYAGWNIPSRHVWWDVYGAQAGMRKYFGRTASERSFSGHHIGIYGQALAYDLQAGNIGQQTPSFNMGAGVEYGYSFPVTLNLNIDLELGVGYMGGRYYEYTVTDGHDTWRGTVRRSWFGPTKASVSLVWLIKSRKNRTKE